MPPESVRDLPPTKEELLDKLRTVGVMPFFQRVVQTPEHAVIDVKQVHSEAKLRIKNLVRDCGKPNQIRCFTFYAPPGYGKTHLLSCTRQLFEHEEELNALFIDVPSFLAGGKTQENHLLESLFEALWLSTHRKRIIDPIHKYLVEAFDTIIAERRGIAKLRIKKTYSNLLPRYLWPSQLKIGHRKNDDQKQAIEFAIANRAILKCAFESFSGANPSGVAGIQPDWDAFVAVCLLTRGNATQRDCANRWFRDDPTMSAEIPEQFHLEKPCQGWAKIRSVFFTLQRLCGCSFCFAVDQVENMIESLKQTENLQPELMHLGTIVDDLNKMPGFCLLFSFQLGEWNLFKKNAPRHLVDRMEDGDGALDLKAIVKDDALAVVDERMKHTVWKALAPLGPPMDEPFFPFTPEEIEQQRLDANSELRNFMKRLHDLYKIKMAHEIDPPPPLIPLSITGLSQMEVLTHEPTPIKIFADHLPPDVDVFFDKTQSPQVVCRPDDGEVEITTPIKLTGWVDVTLQAVDNHSNKDSTQLYFTKKPLKRPYCKNIDRALLRECREERGLTQKAVGEKTGKYGSYVSACEREKNNPSDEFFELLAELYNTPLSAFIKTQSSTPSS